MGLENVCRQIHAKAEPQQQRGHRGCPAAPQDGRTPGRPGKGPATRATAVPSQEGSWVGELRQTPAVPYKQPNWKCP